MMSPLSFFATIATLFFSMGMATPAAVGETPARNAAHASKKKVEDGYIPWVPDYRLVWDDFLCAPKENTDAVASTSTALGIAYQIKNGKLTYQITCKFSKLKSWGLVKTPYILSHEQGHFDITEIFARKLNQALQGYQLNRTTFQKDINTIYESVVKSKEAFQAAYDGDTDHSRNKRKQAEWLEAINMLLENTEPFAHYP